MRRLRPIAVLAAGALSACVHVSGASDAKPGAPGPSTTVALKVAGADASVLARGRGALNAFLAEDDSAFYGSLTAQTQRQLSREKVDAFHTQVLEQSGSLAEVVHEETPPSLGASGTTVYEARVHLSHVPQTFVFSAVFDPAGRVIDFTLLPDSVEAATPYLDYVTQTVMRVPFDGSWTVAWGGRTLADNYHAAVSQQRFAYDLLIFKDGVSHRGEGHANSDYFAFDQPIRAVAAGQVVEVVDGIEENLPGEMNAQAPVGNHVVIDHGHHEFSLYAHLRQGTVAKKVGDHVEAGDELGRCGNSGHSSEPHLHFQLQDSAEFNSTRSLPAPFSHLHVDGIPVEKAEPTRGHVISP